MLVEVWLQTVEHLDGLTGLTNNRSVDDLYTSDGGCRVLCSRGSTGEGERGEDTGKLHVDRESPALANDLENGRGGGGGEKRMTSNRHDEISGLFLSTIQDVGDPPRYSGSAPQSSIAADPCPWEMRVALCCKAAHARGSYSQVRLSTHSS